MNTMKNNKHAIIFFVFVFLLYFGTSLYFNYTQEQNPVVTDLSEEERNMCSLTHVSDNKVALTIPPTYVYGASQADLDAVAQRGGYESVTLNPDGSATYVMTPDQQQEMLAGISQGISAKLSEMCGSKNYKEIASIDHNDDYTDFTVRLSSLGGDEQYSMATISLKLYSTMYNAFDGKGKAPFSVTYINKEGQVVAQSQ